MDAPPPSRIAVVTGASRGLGSAFSRVLAEEGFSLALGARDTAALERVAGELPGNHLAHSLDVENRASVEAFRDAVLGRFGRVDLLVNNAGIGIFKRLDELSEEDFDRQFRVNVRGVWLATKAFLPALEAAGGMVAMISSDVSTRTFPNGGAYTATKFALRALARTLQQEHPNLRVLELRPGATDTFFAGSTQGAEGKDWFLRPESVAEILRLAVRLPSEVRLEEVVLRSRSQPPEY
ncbi:MAG TPA: SDR family oxidoreductase [Thermoanaerobaculia bacterium]|nr:SDR family oxidoreductase [Thermoanaerobaculia bacterium]